MMCSLMHAAHTSPELMRALREVLIEPERQQMQQMLRRAVARGEVSPDNPALDHVMHMMVGAFIARDLIDGGQARRTQSQSAFTHQITTYPAASARLSG
jgi:Tetracyclin repressor-like, C-terminal domain